MSDAYLGLQNRTHRLIVGIVALGAFIGSVNGSFIVIALPTMSRYFNAGTGIVSWVILVYFLVITAFLLTFGRLGDHFGYRPLYIAGLAVFTAGSLLCGLSLSIWHLIGFRVVQGTGAAMLIALSPAIISAFLPESVRGRAFGYLGAANALGLAGGLAMGGLCCDFASWRLAFLVNVPIGAAAFVLALTFLPSNRSMSRKGGFDIPGSVLIFFGLFSLLLVINRGNEYGWGSPEILWMLLLSLLIFGAFYVRERGQQAPLLDLSLFANSHLRFALGAAFLERLVLSGTIFLIPFYLVFVMGYSTNFSGMLMMGPALLLLVIGPVAGILSDRVGSRLLCTLSGLLLAVAAGLFAFGNVQAGLLLILTALTLRDTSMGMFAAPNLRLVLGHSASAEQGMISSMWYTLRYMGSVIGVAAFETVLSGATGLNADSIDRALEAGSSIGVLVQGFQYAFLIGVALSLLIALFSLGAKDSPK